MTRYNPERDVTPAFLDRVAGWIAQTGEVLVVLRYLAAAGARDFVLCRSRAEFEALVAWAPTGTDIIAFGDRQLPLRGVVTDAFVAAAQDAVPAGREYLILTEDNRADAPVSAFSTFDDRENLLDALGHLAGREVAFGECPDFSVADHEAMVSASKGGIDGPR